MIRIRFDQSLAELRRLFDPEIVKKADRMAINKVVPKVRTQISRDTRAVYNVTARAINATVKITNRSRGPVESRLLLYTGGAIRLEHFQPTERRVKSARGPRRAAYVRVRKDRGRKRVGKPDGFHGKGFLGAGHVMARRTAERDSARILYGPSIPQMVDDPSVINSYQETLRREYPVELERAMNLLMARGR